MENPTGKATLLVDKESMGFAAAHFSILETGSETLHGHNYRVALRVRGAVRRDGTVIDFARLKGALREACAELDHRMLVPTACPEVTVTERDDDHVEVREADRRFLFPLADVCFLAVRNTTCECLAGHFLGRLRRGLGDIPVQLEVTVEESPGQGATVSEEAPA
jgi:6-pyruvoyltetrahydropterin/6-carboxytetrahydropterin synthase